MRDIQKVDLGSIQIHRYVIADIAANAIAELKGMRLATDDPWGRVQRFLGLKKQPAIRVVVYQNNQVDVNVKVAIDYGLNIPEMAQRAQDLIREAIERAGDIDLKDININIRGIERGES